MSDSLLVERTVLLGKIESTYNTDSAPDPAVDAFLCADVNVTVDANVLERNNYSPSLSNEASKVGRKLVNLSFTHEIKGSGSIATASKLGTLMRACGMSQTQVANTANAVISDLTPQPDNTGGTVAISAKTTAATSHFQSYKLTIVTGGASGVAEGIWTSDTVGEAETALLRSLEFKARWQAEDSSAAVAVDTADLTAPTFTVSGTWTEDDTIDLLVGGVYFYYQVPNGGEATTAIATALAALVAADARFTGTAASTSVVTVDYSVGAGEVLLTDADTINLGSSGAVFDISITGTLVVGDEFDMELLRPGFHYEPVSDNFESMTFKVYFDGLLHTITGCRGSFSISGEAGNYATASFTFTGQYEDPIVKAIPTASLVYETTDPDQVELANFKLHDFAACAQSFSVDLSNTVSPRTCINARDGFDGVRIQSRNPTGGINPEAVLPSTFMVWRRMSNGDTLPFNVQVGQAVGNRVYIEAPAAQLTGAPYGDRDGDRIYDMTLQFPRKTAGGDDELRFIIA